MRVMRYFSLGRWIWLSNPTEVVESLPIRLGLDGRTRKAMSMSIPTEQDVPSQLSAKLRTLPTLIGVYVILVDQVLRKHGFDPEKCEFVAQQALPAIPGSEEGSAKRSDDGWPEIARIGFVSAKPKPVSSSRPQQAMSCCEDDLLVAVC